MLKPKALKNEILRSPVRVGAYVVVWGRGGSDLRQAVSPSLGCFGETTMLVKAN